MIRPDARVSVAWLPVEQIVLTEHTPLDLDRVLHYVERMTLPQNVGCAPGFVHVKPQPDGNYGILDGRHRFTASLILGYPVVLCAIVDERFCHA